MSEEQELCSKCGAELSEGVTNEALENGEKMSEEEKKEAAEGAEEAAPEGEALAEEAPEGEEAAE